MGIRELRTIVAEAVQAGEDLDEIHRLVIAPARVSQELRDALWLYAWALVEERDRSGELASV